MSTPYALLRLTWRPMTLWLLPVMAFVFFMVFDQGDASFSDIWHGDPSWPVRDALWHLVVLGPMALDFSRRSIVWRWSTRRLHPWCPD